MKDWEETFWQHFADKSNLTYKNTNPENMRLFIKSLLKQQREICKKDDKFLQAQQDYVDNKNDYNITAFQNTEVPALIDLAHDSFDAGYQYAINRIREGEIKCYL